MQSFDSPRSYYLMWGKPKPAGTAHEKNELHTFVKTERLTGQQIGYLVRAFKLAPETSDVAFFLVPEDHLQQFSDYDTRAEVINHERQANRVLNIERNATQSPPAQGSTEDTSLRLLVLYRETRAEIDSDQARTREADEIDEYPLRRSRADQVRNLAPLVKFLKQQNSRLNATPNSPESHNSTVREDTEAPEPSNSATVEEAKLPLEERGRKLKKGVIHPIGAEPPSGPDNKQIWYGPVKGTKAEIGATLHNEERTVQQLARHVDGQLAKGTASPIWLRESPGKKLEAFYKSARLRTTAEQKIIERRKLKANEPI